MTTYAWMDDYLKVIWYIWLYVVMDFVMLQKVNWYMLYVEDIIYCFMCLKLVAYHVLTIKEHRMNQHQLKGFKNIDH
jgi:hypothetical protein